VGGTERTVAPPFRGGAVVDFPVHRLKIFQGTLKITKGGETTIPAFGELLVVKGIETFSSPIGSGGQFYFESLPEGNLEAVIHYKGGECQFPLTIPKTNQRSVNLGELECFLH
jgi:outer membrane usher protein